MAVAGAGVGVRVAVALGGATVGVRVGPVGVAVRVGVGSVASFLISKDRADDQALNIPPAVRARTRHQNRRSLVKVWVVWVEVSPVWAAINGLLNELESSNWTSYVAAPDTALHENGMGWLSGSRAPFAGLSSVGAGGGVGVGGAPPPPVVLIKTFKNALAPPTAKATSGLLSPLKSLAVIKMPPRLDWFGGMR